MKPFLIAALAFSASILTAQEKIELRLNLDKGDEFTVTTSTAQVITQQVMGTEQVIRQDMSFEVDYSCVEASVSSCEMIMVFDRIQTFSSSLGQEERYDSNNPSAEPTGNALIYSGLVGTELTADYNNLGEVTKMSGMDVMVDNIVEAVSSKLEMDSETLKSQIEKTMTDESFTKNFTAAVMKFPIEKVGVGDSWTQNSTLNSGMEIAMETRYTINSITSDEVVIDVFSTLKTQSSDEPTMIQGMEVQYNMSGTQTGVIHIDRETGWTMSSSIKQEVSGEMEFLPSEQMPQGMSFPMDMSTVVTVVTE